MDREFIKDKIYTLNGNFGSDVSVTFNVTLAELSDDGFDSLIY